jgi:hypothetical protein
MRVTVDVDTDDIREDRTADSRGRVSLGPEFAGETVTVAVVKPEDDESDAAECPNGCRPLAVQEVGVDGTREVYCPDCGYVGGRV